MEKIEIVYSIVYENNVFRFCVFIYCDIERITISSCEGELFEICKNIVNL